MIDGTGETERPDVTDIEDFDHDARADDEIDDVGADDEVVTPWEPSFDHDDDLDGLLEVSSPLLSRAFRGADRRTS